MFDKLKTFAHEHPWGFGALIFVLGAILIYFLWPRSSGAATTSTNAADSYYNAAAASTISGNQVLANQQAITGQVAQTQITTDAALAATKATLDAQTAQVTNTNSALVQVAGLQSDLQKTVATLSAGVANSAIGANITANNNATAIQNQQILAGGGYINTLAEALSHINPDAYPAFVAALPAYLQPSK